VALWAVWEWGSDQVAVVGGPGRTGKRSQAIS
jgi:hypothetical protein